MPGPLIAVLVGLATSQVSIFLTTVFLHRALAHRSLTMSPGLLFACRALTWLTTGLQPRQWVAVHRRHHAFTDVEGDPHSPVLVGFLTVQAGNAVLYRRVARDGVTVDRYAKDLAPDRWDRAVFDHGFVGLALGFGVLLLVFFGNWELAAIAAATHVVSYLFLNAAVNAVGHRFGRRPYAGYAANSQWLAWLTAGEGLHSNHHAAPTSARLALARGEVDPGWWVIALWRRLGWVQIRHSSPRVRGAATRPEPGLGVPASTEEDGDGAGAPYGAAEPPETREAGVGAPAGAP